MPVYGDPSSPADVTPAQLAELRDNDDRVDKNSQDS